MKAILAALFSIVTLSACVTAPTIAPMSPRGESPRELVQWTASPPKSFEATHPGMGASYGFNSAAGFANVYVYTIGITDWRAGISDPRLGPHLLGTLEDIRQAERSGNYRNVKISQEASILIADQEFKLVNATYEFRGDTVKSALLLSVRNGKLLKFRITLYDKAQVDLPSVVDSLVRMVLSDDPSLKPVAF